MRTVAGHLMLLCTILCLSLLGCNLPRGTAAPDLRGTIVASTLGVLQTSAAATQTAQEARSSPTEPLAPTETPSSTPTPGNPQVTSDALCWVGPGNQYEVVSAIRKGTNVELLGKGTIPGWYIVRNPIYRDPCWIQASALRIDPSLDLSGLPSFSPPATPEPTETHTPVPTDTP